MEEARDGGFDSGWKFGRDGRGATLLRLQRPSRHQGKGKYLFYPFLLHPRGQGGARERGVREQFGDPREDLRALPTLCLYQLREAGVPLLHACEGPAPVLGGERFNGTEVLGSERLVEPASLPRVAGGR